MRNGISLKLYIVMVMVIRMGTCIGVTSSPLKSKVLHGIPAEKEHKYLASLQLDGKHICSSGLFKKGYLLTSGDCAWFIGRSINTGGQHATAVLGHWNLQRGRRIDVRKVSYFNDIGINYAKRPDDNYEVGVIMLSDKADYTDVEFIELYPRKIDLRYHGVNPKVCGWGTDTVDDVNTISMGNAKYSDTLKCAYVKLLSPRKCTTRIVPGDYRRKKLCGQGFHPYQMTTLGDVGSPLTRFVHDGDNGQNYIIGVTFRRYVGDIHSLLRFVRIDYVLDSIGEMEEELRLPTAGNVSCIITRK